MEFNNIWISDSYLKTSKKDLEASKLLYKDILYPQSVFSLQQCIEKASKSLLMILDLADYEEIKSHIGHKVYKIINLYKEILKDIKQKNEIVIKFLPGLKYSILNEAIGLMNTILSIPEEVENISEEWNKSEKKIDEIIERIREDYKEVKRVKEGVLPEEVTGKIKEFIQLTRNELNRKSIHEDDTAILESVFSNSKLANFSILYLPLFLLYSLFQLSILTFKHVNISRYPEKDKQVDPIKYYNKNTPIIKKFNAIVEITELILKELENKEKIIFMWNKFKELLKDIDENLK